MISAWEFHLCLRLMDTPRRTGQIGSNQNCWDWRGQQGRSECQVIRSDIRRTVRNAILGFPLLAGNAKSRARHPSPTFVTSDKMGGQTYRSVTILSLLFTVHQPACLQSTRVRVCDVLQAAPASDHLPGRPLMDHKLRLSADLELLNMAASGPWVAPAWAHHS